MNGRFFFGNTGLKRRDRHFISGGELVQAAKTGWETKLSRPGIHETQAARQRVALLFHLLAKQEQFIEIAGIIE